MEDLTGRLRAVLFGLLIGLAAVPGTFAQRTEVPEASVKAAFLFKFTGFVEWAAGEFESPTSPLVIGVVDADEVAAELARIVPGRSVNGHPVTVKRLAESEPPRGVHIVFIGREAPRQAQLLRAAQQQGALAVTETTKGLDLGSAINFVVADDRVGFEVSLDGAERGGHQISARMLQVARRVIPKGSS